MDMPSLSKLSLDLNPARRRSRTLVGLDVQPGYVAAVQAHANGSLVVEHATGAALPPDTVRDGEVLDENVLSDALRELFKDGHLGKHVRVGVANQRTVLRTLELPPLTDRKELAAAVRFQAEDQMPMPLSGAVLDFHPLATIETPAGPRQRVVVVAAQRDMVERLLAAVRGAGLRPDGVDLSAFALIRSLYRREAAPSEADSESSGTSPRRVLYLNVGGLTNMAIAEGTTCRFTRVVGGGLESMAAEIAERRGVPLAQARELLEGIDMSAPKPVQAPPAALPSMEEDLSEAIVFEQATPEADQSESPAEAASAEEGVSAGELHSRQEHATAHQPPSGTPGQSGGSDDGDIRGVLTSGVREIAGEVRNSLDFHRSQDGGGEVASVVLSGAALEIAGFPEALESELGFSVERRSVELAGQSVSDGLSVERLAVAAGLAVQEVNP